MNVVPKHCSTSGKSFFVQTLAQEDAASLPSHASYREALQTLIASRQSTTFLHQFHVNRESFMMHFTLQRCIYFNSILSSHLGQWHSLPTFLSYCTDFSTQGIASAKQVSTAVVLFRGRPYSFASLASILSFLASSALFSKSFTVYIKPSVRFHALNKLSRSSLIRNSI